MEEKLKANVAGEKSPTDTNSDLLLAKLTKSPVRSIESPKYGLGLSPIQKFMNVHSPTTSPTQNKKDFNIDTQSQKVMLQHATNKLKETSEVSNEDKDEGLQDYLRDQSPTQIIQNIPI